MAYAVSASPSPVNENAGTITFTITRSGSFPAETIFASTLNGASNGYAVNNSDYATNVNNLPVSFSAGQTTATVTLSITNDSIVEPDELFGFIVQRNTSDPVTTFLAKTNWTIRNDDVAAATYSVSASPSPVDENAGTVTFTITRSGSFPAETIFASTLNGAANGYAVNNSDYATDVNNLPVSFSAGQTTATVTLSITNDSIVEPDELFGFIVQRNTSDPVTTFLAKTNWTIRNDDVAAATYSVSASPSPVDENAGTVTFTITRSGSFPAETIFASTLNGASNGYAVNNSDYATNVNNLPVSFSAGQTTATVTLSITNDSIVEPDELFGFIVQRNTSDPVTTFLAKTNWTIRNDDVAAATYSVSASPSPVDENAGTVTFTITRSGSFPAETIFASTLNGASNGYAVNNSDYATDVNNLPVSFSAGQTTATVTLSITNDSIVEPDELFGFIVQRNTSDPVTTFLAKTNWTIRNDDVAAATYSVSASPSPVDENAGTVTFTITRSGSFPAETIFASTLNGASNGYAVNNSDYATDVNNLPVSFSAGQTTATVTLSITNDSIVEPDELFGFIVQRNTSDPVTTFLAKTNWTIRNDDVAAATYSVSASPSPVDENAGTVTFTITRSGSFPAETIFASTLNGASNGYAVNNSDYATDVNNLPVSFSAGQTTATVTLSITNDSIVEPDELFGFIVQRNTSDPVTTFLAKTNWTIRNDDVAAATYSVSASPSPVDENAGTVTFTITRSGSFPAETIFASTLNGASNGYAVNNSDYATDVNNLPVSFSAGQTTATVTLSITNDSIVEPDELFGFIVQRNTSDPVTTFLAKTNWTIRNDDVAAATYSVSASPSPVDENAGTVTFTITRSGSFPAETIFASTLNGAANGYAVNNSDYATDVNNLPVSFSAGQTTATVTLSITNDSIVEPDELFGFIVQRNTSDPVTTFLAKTNWTIRNDDVAAATYSVSASPSPVDENAGTVTFTITRSGSFPAETIFASTLNGASNGYAVNNSDYATNVNNLPVSFSAGQTTATVTLSITNDSIVEPDELFGFIVQRNTSDPVTTFLAKTNWTIHDDETAATSYSVSANPDPVDENAGTVTFTVTRSGSSLPAETLFASTLQGYSNGYAANSSDYNGLLDQQVSFSSGQASAQVTVSVINDTVLESDDTFGFIVQRNASDSLSTFLAKTNWTIHDDDSSTATNYSVVASPNPVNEFAGTATFTITRSGGLPAETLYASTLNGSAIGYSGNANDYNGLVNQQVSFAANQTSAQVTISINNDTVPENDETFGFIVQRNASDSVATNLAQTNWTIDDDDTGTIADYSVTPSARIVNVNQGPITFTVARTGTNLPAETVFASTVEGVNGFATNTGDWTNSVHFQPVNFLAGATTATSTVSLELANVASAAAVLKDFGLVLQRSQDANFLNHLTQTNFTIAPNAVTTPPGVDGSIFKLPFSSKLGQVGVTQEFGEASPSHGTIDPDHPADRYLHYAIDFALPQGTAVLSQGTGIVIETRDSILAGTGTPEGFGNYVTVEYEKPGGGYLYATYMHMLGAPDGKQIIPATTDGQPTKVSTGLVLGYSGNTGPTPAHLHVTWGDELIDYVSGQGSHFRMADGSVAANPVGAPIKFAEGQLTTGQSYTSDNDFGLALSTSFGEQQPFIGGGAHSTFTFYADPVSTPSVALNAQGSFATLTNTDLGKVVAQITEFGEAVFNGIKNIAIGFLNGTGLLGHTVYVNGADGGDNIDASATDTSVVATGGNGNDILVGGFAGDVLNGGPGNDAIDGGAGIDTANYSNAASAVAIDLRVFGAQDTGGAGTDTLAQIEMVIGSAYNDTLTGDGGANRLEGGGGNDILNGGGGDDTLVFDALDAIVVGGAGIDTAIFTGSTNGLRNFDFIGHEVEILNWTTNGNVYDLRPIAGAARLETVTDVANTEAFASRTTTLDALLREELVDLVDDTGNRYVYDYDAGNLAGWSRILDVYRGASALDYRDTSYDDGRRVIFDGDQDNAFTWLSVQTIYSAPGVVDYQDTQYDDGRRVIFDGDQANAYNWSSITSSYFPSGALDDQIFNYDDGTRIVYDGDGAGNYFIYGDGGSNQIFGEAGNDTLDGMGGVDQLFGFAGNDRMYFDALDAIVDGGAGIDTAIFTDSTNGLRDFDFAGHNVEILNWTRNDNVYDLRPFSGGARLESVTDTASTETFASRTTTLDAMLREELVDLVGDTGNRLVYDYDAANAAGWNRIIDAYEGLSTLDYRDTNYDDGSRVVRDEDQASAFNWTSITATYSPSAAVDYQDYVYDNGSRVIFDGDQDNAFTWLSVQTIYSAPGVVDYQDTAYDDGRRVIYDSDQASEFPWASRSTSYAPGNVLDVQDTQYDDGTRVIYDWDNGDASAYWDIWESFYNAAGVLTTQRITLDGGVVVIYNF